MKIFGVMKPSDITRQQLALAAKKLGKRVTPKADKAMLLRSVAVGLIDRNIIKIVEGDGSNIQKKDIAKVSTFNVFCN